MRKKKDINYKLVIALRIIIIIMYAVFLYAIYQDYNEAKKCNTCYEDLKNCRKIIYEKSFNFTIIT